MMCACALACYRMSSFTLYFCWLQVQEFARVLLDRLDEVMQIPIDVSNAAVSSDVHASSSSSSAASPSAAPVTSFIKENFEGISQTYISCLNVDYTSTRDESFYDISLDVQGNESLLASFQRYVAPERMEGANQYRTPNNGLQDADRGTRFARLPRVLQLQLKRFAYDPEQDRMTKVNDRFTFPVELDLSSIASRTIPTPTAAGAGSLVAMDAPSAPDFPSLSSRSDVTNALPEAIPTPPSEFDYLLHSVLVHSGHVHGGHYYAFVRPNPMSAPDEWFRIDDDHVARCANPREAIEDNFGGSASAATAKAVADSILSSHFSQSFVAKESFNMREHNAYMLTYVRKLDAPELLQTVRYSHRKAVVVFFKTIFFFYRLI